MVLKIFEALLNVDTRPEKVEPIKEELPFTLADVRQAVPKELFQAHIPTSFYYILRDLAQFAITAYLTSIALSYTENSWLRALIWFTYAFVQGTTGFGLWVIGHECGHQGYFGDGHWLNDPIGYVIHSAYCDPYHSWRITHATHHRYTNNKELDTAFPPKDYPVNLYEIGEYFPPIHVFLIAMYVSIGWPLYICANLEGHRYPNFQNHFNPNAPMFEKRDRMDVIMSDIGVVAMLCVLASFANAYGFWNVFMWYGLPWIGTHSWLVLVTFLQHSDARVPHYEDDGSFTFLKGAISTVDRDYGAILNNMMHHITDKHMAHHVFSRIPFYQADKATPYIAKVIGKHYITDNRNILVQLWDSWFAHQSSFFHSKSWAAANPGKTIHNWPTLKKNSAASRKSKKQH